MFLTFHALLNAKEPSAGEFECTRVQGKELGHPDKGKVWLILGKADLESVPLEQLRRVNAVKGEVYPEPSSRTDIGALHTIENTCLAWK